MATVEDERVHQLFSEFAKASDALLSKSLERTQSYAEVVNDYRKLEAEFVARMGDSEFGVLETRRRIAESILMVAHDYNPSFEVCREAWNDLVRLGFTNLYVKCTNTWFYADCCAYDELPEEGLAVVEPLLTELQQRLDEARASQRSTRFYEDNIETLGDLRDELEAQKRGEVIPWRETRRADDAYQITPEEEQADALREEFVKARLAVFKTHARSWERSFVAVAQEYRQIEADFLARAGTGEAFEAFLRFVRRQLTQDIFYAACGLQRSFDVCQKAWDELVRVGFTSTSERWTQTETYAEGCARNDQPEAGLAVIEPLIEEITRLLEEPKKKLQPPPRYTRVELERRLAGLRELRDKLEAQRRRSKPST